MDTQLLFAQVVGLEDADELIVVLVQADCLDLVFEALDDQDQAFISVLHLFVVGDIVLNLVGLVELPLLGENFVGLVRSGLYARVCVLAGQVEDEDLLPDANLAKFHLPAGD